MLRSLPTKTARFSSLFFKQKSRALPIPLFHQRHTHATGDTEDTAFSSIYEHHVSPPDENGSYFKHLTIPQGERMAVWKRNGSISIIDGPASKYFTNIVAYRFLTRFTAEPSQFLRIIKRDGTKQYEYGPTSLWEDPVEHESIRISEGISVNSNEALVVYRQESETSNVQRSIVHGPCVHLPTSNEWLHRFVWHGADPNHTTRKIPSALQFTKLRLVPDQMYFNVEGVRSRDDALVTVKLMIFFQLESVERLLDTTHDPIADFINETTADVIDFCGKFTFEDFKNQAGALNKLETYQQLVSKSSQIGYSISKVVFRGYEASSALQRMHDESIEKRTALQLAAETEEQEQALQSFKLQKQQERAQQKRDLEMQQLIHEQDMQQLAHEKKLARDQESYNERLNQIKSENAASLEYYNSLHKELGVDLTKLLTTQKPDKLVQIQADGNVPHYHCHE